MVQSLLKNLLLSSSYYFNVSFFSLANYFESFMESTHSSCSWESSCSSPSSTLHHAGSVIVYWPEIRDSKDGVTLSTLIPVIFICGQSRWFGTRRRLLVHLRKKINSLTRELFIRPSSSTKIHMILFYSTTTISINISWLVPSVVYNNRNLILESF